MLEVKLNVVNKREYEENQNYREIIIRLPKSDEELKRDFEYLGLDYDNLSIQDSHILDCEVIDTNDPHFSGAISTELSNIIDRASDSGWTTPYQDIKSMYAILALLSEEKRDKLLAILEFKREEISNMKDAVKFGNNLSNFVFFNNINTPEDYAEELIRARELSVDDIMDYIDLGRLGKECIQSDNAKFTEQGLIFEKDEVFRNYQEEEKFE